MNDVRAHLVTLAHDAACRKVVAHLNGAGHRPIFLKGATIATWIYDDPSERLYSDLDVLVDPAERDQIVESLRGIGYHRMIDERMERASGPEEIPLANGAGVHIDLHVSLKGVRVAPHQAWAVLDRSTVAWDWTGVEVRALAPGARAMHLALHAAQRGHADVKAVNDLRLGLAKLDHATWLAAGRVAFDLGATQAFGAGLMLLPDGRRLTTRLGLDSPTDLEVRLRAASASTGAVYLERARSAAGWIERLRVVRDRLFPSAQWLRLHQPQSTATRWGLMRARASRPVSVVVRLPRALREIRTARVAHASLGEESDGVRSYRRENE